MFNVFNECILSNTETDCATISGAVSPFLRILSMEFPPSDRYRGYTEYIRVIWHAVTADCMICQTPTIDTVRVKRL